MYERRTRNKTSIFLLDWIIIIFMILKLTWTVIYYWKRLPYFSEPFLQQGISLEYVMVDFICMGLFDLWGTRTGNSKWKILAQSGIQNSGPSDYEYSLSVALLVELSIDHLNIDRVLPEFAIKLYLCRVQRSRCSKMYCHVLNLIYS